MTARMLRTTAVINPLKYMVEVNILLSPSIQKMQIKAFAIFSKFLGPGSFLSFSLEQILKTCYNICIGGLKLNTSIEAGLNQCQIQIKDNLCVPISNNRNRT